MICHNCNHEIEEGSMFCGYCGARQVEQPIEQPAYMPSEKPTTEPVQMTPEQTTVQVPPSPVPPNTMQVPPSPVPPNTMQVPPERAADNRSTRAVWIISIAGVVVVAMILVFFLVILPQISDRNTQSASIIDDSAVAEASAEEQQPIEETPEQPPEHVKSTAPTYSLDDLGASKYGVFVGQGGRYYPIYMPAGFSGDEFTFDEIDYDMIPTMHEGDKLVFSNVDNVEFTISPVSYIDDTSLDLSNFGKYVLVASSEHGGQNINVFSMPKGVELSYAELYYIHAESYGSSGSRSGFTGLVFVQDSVFKPKTDTPAPAGYIIPGSDRRYIDESDLWGLSQWETRLARNEIYARYGHNFRTESIQRYFESTSWYVNDPYYGHNTHKPSFNKYERYNVSFIKRYEERMGW